MEEHRLLVQAQIQCLSNFKYCRTIVVNHTDSSLLPSSTQDRRDLNLIMASSSALKTLPRPADDWSALTVQPSYAMATHVLPRVTGVYQTTNPIVPPRADAVLSVARLERALVTRGSKRALRELWTDGGEGRAWRWGCEGQRGGRLGPLQGAGILGADKESRTPGLWLCGSYASCGIPLLEGCVVSATNVVEQGIWACEGI